MLYPLEYYKRRGPRKYEQLPDNEHKFVINTKGSKHRRKFYLRIRNKQHTLVHRSTHHEFDAVIGELARF